MQNVVFLRSAAKPGGTVKGRRNCDSGDEETTVGEADASSLNHIFYF